MKRRKARTLEEYFSSQTGMGHWRKGYSLFDVTKGDNSIPDGTYFATIKSAYFDVPKKGRPYNVLLLDVNGKEIKKYTALDEPEGIASLLAFFKILGLNVKKPDHIAAAYSVIESDKPGIEIEVLNTDEFRHVRIVKRVNGASPQIMAQPEPPPMPPEQPGMASAEPIAILATSATREPIQEPPVQDVEVEINPGDRLAIRNKGVQVEVTVVKTLDEEGELIVLTPSGERELIPVEAIISKL